MNKILLTSAVVLLSITTATQAKPSDIFQVCKLKNEIITIEGGRVFISDEKGKYKNEVKDAKVSERHTTFTIQYNKGGDKYLYRYAFGYAEGLNTVFTASTSNSGALKSSNTERCK